MPLNPEAIFHAAAVLSGNERDAYLCRACEGDPSLRLHVERLLHVDLPLTEMFHRVAGVSLLTTTVEVLPAPLGRYVLEERLGEGAFGVVYRAAQQTPVRRNVAVKVLRPGLDSAQIVRRFEVERQALASLDHPNIARLLDAANTPDGRPYFVMELLNGRPFTRYCDDQTLSLRDRLQLFLQVCAAVEHAHRRSVLHRDLKPSNILVIHADAGPIVKVIDFGIARALGSEMPLGTLATEAGRLMGTLEYMSPEQIDGAAATVDIGADIYALGALLYEVLCGRLPFDSRQLRSARFSELRRIVCECAPCPPSLAWEDVDAGDDPAAPHLEDAIDLDRAAAHRSLAPSALMVALKSEIEWVPMRALRKLPIDRYRSVTEMADDVRNYLAGRPLIAGPDSATYRAKKFVQRHRSTMATSVAIVTLLIAAVAGTSIGMVRARRALAVADLERDRAELRLVDSLIAQGQAATDQSQFIDAWDAFVQARAIHQRRGTSSLATDLGLYGVLEAADPPAAVLETEQAGKPWLAYVDNGETLLSSGPQRSIEWNTSTLRRSREMPFQIVAVSPDGQTLYTQINFADLVARDRKSLLVTARFEVERATRYERFVTSPDGKWLVGRTTGFGLTVWDARTGLGRAHLKVDSPGDIRGIAFSPDGSRAVTVGSSSTLNLWDAQDWRRIRSFDVYEPQSELTEAAFLFDGKSVGFSGSTGNVRMLDIASGTVTALPSSSSLRNDALGVSPDGRWMACGGDEAGIQLFDLLRKTSRPTFGHRKPVWSIVFAPDGRHYASASFDGEIRLWDAEADRASFEVRQDHPNIHDDLTFSADDHLFLAIASNHDDRSSVWDVDRRSPVCQMQYQRPAILARGVRFSADGRHFIAAQSSGTPGWISSWDASTGQRVAQVGHTFSRGCRSFFLADDGSRTIANTDEEGIAAWDEQGHELWRRSSHRREWFFCSYAEDGAYIAKTTDDGKVEVIRGDNGSTILTFQTADTVAGFAEVAFAPRMPGKLIWSHEFDNRPHLFDFNAKRQIWVLGEQQHQRSAWLVMPDGKTIAVGNGGRRYDFYNMSDGSALFSAVLPKGTTRWTISPRQAHIAYTDRDNALWIGDLTVARRLVDSDQLHARDGRSP